MIDDTTKLFLEKTFYPVVRVRTKRASGSGTVVYSKPTENDAEEYETYVLTNHHVVEDAITVEKKYVAKIGRKREEETRSTVDVEFFNREFHSRHVGTLMVKAEILAWHQEQDLALLKLRSVKEAEYIADIYDEPIKDIHIMNETIATGAAMGDNPIPTTGVISGMDKEIENFSYWTQTAPTIFGNSGGAVFLKRNLKYIGIPARIGVTMLGFSANAITHLSYFIPIDRIADWLKDVHYDFIVDNTKTPNSCQAEREAERKAELRLMEFEQQEDAK